MTSGISRPIPDGALSAVACATRVTSLLSIFLGRLDGSAATDSFDPRQGVELKWRELTGMTQSDDLARHVRANSPPLRRRILESSRPGALAAVASMDVIAMLLDDSVDNMERIYRIVGLAFSVAMEMDRTLAAPPRGQRSWSAFELRSQAEIIDLISGVTNGFSAEFIDELRMTSGAQSMAYRNAMKGLS